MRWTIIHLFYVSKCTAIDYLQLCNAYSYGAASCVGPAGKGVKSVIETDLACTKCRYHHLVVLVDQYRFVIQTRHFNTVHSFIYFYGTCFGRSMPKRKHIIGKVCYGRGMCRSAAQLSVRRDVNSVAEEGRLLDKNGICRYLIGSYFYSLYFFRACPHYKSLI